MVELDERNFDEVVTDAPGPVLVDFWAKLDVGAFPNVAWAFDVLSVPTVVLFEGGVPVRRVVGAVPASRLEQLLDAPDDGEDG